MKSIEQVEKDSWEISFDFRSRYYGAYILEEPKFTKGLPDSFEIPESYSYHSSSSGNWAILRIKLVDVLINAYEKRYLESSSLFHRNKGPYPFDHIDYFILYLESEEDKKIVNRAFFEKQIIWSIDGCQSPSRLDPEWNTKIKLLMTESLRPFDPKYRDMLFPFPKRTDLY